MKREGKVVFSYLPIIEEPEKEGVSLREDEVAYQVPLVRMLRLGLPIDEFFALQELIGLSEEELARFLGISATTLHRRKKTKQLITSESERVLRVARLFGLAVEVLESEEAAREWLKAENPALSGESPLSYADTEFGAREVENVLGRLDHGIF